MPKIEEKWLKTGLSVTKSGFFMTDGMHDSRRSEKCVMSGSHKKCVMSGSYEKCVMPGSHKKCVMSGSHEKWVMSGNHETKEISLMK